MFSTNPYELELYLNDIRMSSDDPRVYLKKEIPEKIIVDSEDSGIYFGLEKKNGKGYYVGKKSEDDGNVLVVGTNGSGKSALLAKSTIETWRDPLVVLDCKGELWQHYKSLQEKNQVTRPFILFDPIGHGTQYNPFAILKRDSEHFVQNVREIAFALIPEPVNDINSYWINMARDLLSAIIIFGFSNNFDFIETMIIAVKLSVSDLCKKVMEFDSEPNAEYARMFIREINKLKSEHQAAIGTEMKQHLMVFVTDQFVQKALSDGDKSFSWDDIATVNDAPNIFLCLSQDRLEQWGSMTRLMLTQLIRTLERRPDKYSDEGCELKPILLLLDEFPLLGKMDVIKNALTTLRSRKVTFCLMIQSIAQLDSVYGHDVRKIIVDNCQYKALLNITEPESQKYFSDLIGTILTHRRSISRTQDGYDRRPTYAEQFQEVREPAILPHQFATNRDIWLHTPYGFFCTYKLPVSVTFQHLNCFIEIINNYHEGRNEYG